MSQPALEVLFSRQGDAWRMYVEPNRPPCRVLYLDEHREAYPVRFDAAELDAQMFAADAPYEKSETSVGGVLVRARGRSAIVLSVLLEGLAEGAAQAG